MYWLELGPCVQWFTYSPTFKLIKKWKEKWIRFSSSFFTIFFCRNLTCPRGVALSCHVATPHRACRLPWRDLDVSLTGSPWQVRSRCCPTSDASWRRWTRPSSSTPSPSSWATKRRSSASRGSSRSCWYWTRRRWSSAARGGWVGGWGAGGGRWEWDGCWGEGGAWLAFVAACENDVLKSFVKSAWFPPLGKIPT